MQIGLNDGFSLFGAKSLKQMLINFTVVECLEDA